MSRVIWFKTTEVFVDPEGGFYAEKCGKMNHMLHIGMPVPDTQARKQCHSEVRHGNEDCCSLTVAGRWE